MDKSLHEKLITIEASLPEIEKQLSEIDISRDQKAYAEMAKKHSDVSTIVELFVEWKDINLEIADAEETDFVVINGNCFRCVGVVSENHIGAGGKGRFGNDRLIVGYFSRDEMQAPMDGYDDRIHLFL